jgi:hypothetical protein
MKRTWRERRRKGIFVSPVLRDMVGLEIVPVPLFEFIREKKKKKENS